MKDLSSYRKDYLKHILDEENTPSNPFTLFNQWFNESEKTLYNKEINSMVLNTIGNDGFPKGRLVLLKYFSRSTIQIAKLGESIHFKAHLAFSIIA